MSTQNPAKRIPKGLKTETKLFGKYTLTDLAVGLSPGVLVILAAQLLAPEARLAGYSIQTFVLPVAALAIAGGALFVYLTPAYTTSFDWIGTFLGYRRRAHDHDHEAARAFTQFERVHPDHGAIERTDGAMFGMVRVDPAAMALATPAEWRAQAAAFEDFLNTVVEFPIQLYATTRAFPVEEYLGHYERRLDDADAKANPHLAALLREYIDWYAGELDARRMTIRDHYVVVPVTPAEVRFERESLLDQLARLPVIGLFLRAILADHREIQRTAMFEALDDRLGRVASGLRELDGCSARRVSASDAALVVAEFWAGEELDYGSGDGEGLFRTRPFVGGARP